MTGGGGGLRLPLSEAQLGVWHARRLDPASPAYDLGGYAEIRGGLDAELLERAAAAMVAEVAALRVRFDDTTDPVSQVVAPAAPPPLARLDFGGAADPAAQALAWIRAQLAEPRDPTRDPVLEVALVRLADDLHWWYARSHHLVLDGYSVPLVCGRVAQIYTALARGTGPGPSPFGPYRLLLDAERAYRAGADFAADRGFWLDRMAGAPDIPTLATRTGPPLGPFHRSSMDLPPALADALRRRGPGRAWVPVLMAAFAGYLSRLTGASELRLGVPMASRSGPLLRIPGNAANLLPLRVAAPPGQSAAELTATVGAELRQVRRHHRYRGEELARELGAVGAGPAIFGPSVNIRDFDHGLVFGEAETVLRDVTAGPVEDLTLSVRRRGDAFALSLDGNAGAYTRAEVEAHLPRFVDHLAGFADRLTRPGRSAGPPRYTGHRHGDVVTGRAPQLAEAFAGQARRTPYAVALRDGDRSWTFTDLAGRVARLAGVLRRAGVGPERLVALALPRSAEYVVALLAVARAGGAWLPLDPGHPPQRLAQALRTSPPALILVAGPSAGPPPAAGVPVLSVAADGEHAPLWPVPAAGREAEPDGGQDPPWPAPDPANLAYAIATSGSTGLPRTVEVSHGALANLLRSHRTGVMTRLPAGARLRIGHTAPFTVDAALDPLLWMVAGHELVLLPEETYRDPHALVRAVRAERLDLVDAPPSYLGVLLDAGLLDPGPARAGGHRPTVVVFGGEAAPAQLWARLRAVSGPRLLLNAYGPTEFTVDALLAEVASAELPVLGVPVAGSRALVLDGALRPVPEGGVGELYLGGPGIARGYAGQPGLTAARFVADPFGPPGDRLLRAGDLVRVRFGGELEFLGRVDDQVKIRGFRVEPREVQAVLAGHPAVQACAVVPKPGRGGLVLVGYVVPRPAAAGADLAGTLLVYARTLLPDHLVPAAIVPLPVLPLTAGGVLDRRALPDPGLLSDRPYRAPGTPTEAALCASFADVLGTDRVGVDDDFFALGGHSLLAGRLLGVIRTRLGADLSLRTIFTHRTAHALARTMDAADRFMTVYGTERTGHDWMDVPLSSGPGEAGARVRDEVSRPRSRPGVAG
jgi:amino acid adenylation domain-containing protein